MLEITKGDIFLESRKGFEFEMNGVLNPACIEKDNFTYMFYRAVGKNNISTIGCCQVKDNQVINQSNIPVLFPEYQYESHGLEDPRITYLDGQYYLFYTAYNGHDAVVAYATSNDLKTFSKKGIITPQFSYDEAEDIFRNSGVTNNYLFFENAFKKKQGKNVYLWEKDTLLFPRKINGKYTILHRILPGIQICYFDNFEQLTQNFWRQYLVTLNDFVVMDPKYNFEKAYIGGGCVPIETSAGWLLIYHSVEEDSKCRKTYHACVALLDKNNPQKIIGRLPYPLFSPTNDWEKRGVVNNVVFPTGTTVNNDILSIYYGAADTRIGVRTMSLSSLLNELIL